MPHHFRQGDIVIAPVSPDAGELKDRPAVILSTTASMVVTGSADVIAVTGSFDPADVHRYFPLPWRDDGNVPTRLRKPSAASRTMVQTFAMTSLRHRSPSGYLTRGDLTRLLAWLASL